MPNLSDNNLIMLVAPSAMGKTTITSKLPALDERFSRVRGFTTRPRRSDDAPDQFFYLSDQELIDKRLNDETVTELVFPNTGYVYGTVAESYQSEYCVLETLANTVTLYEPLPFKSTRAISIVCPVDQWHHQFIERYPDETIDAWARLQEATSSLRWSLEKDSQCWVINDTTVDEAARKLLDCILDNHRSDDGAAHAQAILERIEKGVWL